LQIYSYFFVAVSKASMCTYSSCLLFQIILVNLKVDFRSKYKIHIFIMYFIATKYLLDYALVEYIGN